MGITHAPVSDVERTVEDAQRKRVDVVPQPVLRRRCCYCSPMHAQDGLGPILPGQRASDGICAEAMAVQMAEFDAREFTAAH